MLQPKLPSLVGDKFGTPPFEAVSIAKVSMLFFALRKVILVQEVYMRCPFINPCSACGMMACALMECFVGGLVYEAHARTHNMHT